MRTTRGAFPWLVVLPLAVGACAKDEKPAKTEAKTEQPATADTKPAEAEAADPIQLPPGDGPVAKVNGEAIPRELFNREYTQTLERYQKARHDVKPALRERLKDNIVRRLVDAELIRQQAEKMKIDVPQDELDQKWSEHKKRYGSEDAFKAFLERAGTTADDVRRQFEQNILREKVFERVGESVTVEAKEVRAFYDDNQARYDEPEQIKASHILIRVPPNASEDDKAKKKEQAQEVRKKIAKGADFAKMAKEHGEDPTKDRGGDLGYFTKGRMVKPFEAAAWKLKKGEVSPVVETQFGYHIIKKTDHKKARKKPFGEVKDQIKRSLEARKRNQAIREALKNWKDEAEIEIIVKGDESVISAGQPKRPRVNPAEIREARPMNKERMQLKRQGDPDTSDRPAE